MTDKISKFLKKLSKKDLAVIKEITEKIIKDDTSGLDIKKLKGTSTVYRARKGSVRIIFTRQNQEVNILQISKRDEHTYSKY